LNFEKLIKFKKKAGQCAPWNMEHVYVCMYINTDVNIIMLQLYLEHDFTR